MTLRQDITVVAIDALPSAVREDIAHNLAERHPFFVERRLDHVDVRDNLFGLVQAPKVLVAMAEVGLLPETMDRQCSAAAVATYAGRLKSVPGFEFDPILANGEAFLDGGHRLEAYAQAGRRYIPIVDIGHLMRASEADWQAWFDGSTDPANPIYGSELGREVPALESLPTP